MIQYSIHIIILMIFVLSSCQVNKSCNCKEKIIFESQLKIIENYTVFDSTNNNHNIPRALFIIEMISDIASEADGTFLGKMNPSRTDYLLWINWYKEKKDSLCDEKYRSKIDSFYKIAYPNIDEIK